MTIRDATEADLPAIVAIYNASIPGRLATADTVPVTVESRYEWFHRHNPNSGRPLWILEHDAEIAGWLGFSSFYGGRPAYQATAEISIYIGPRFQQRGFGKRLLEEAIQRSPSLGVTTLLYFCFSHNTPSLKLCSSLGFEPWGELPRIAQLDGVERSLILLGRRCE